MKKKLSKINFLNIGQSILFYLLIFFLVLGIYYGLYSLSAHFISQESISNHVSESVNYLASHEFENVSYSTDDKVDNYADYVWIKIAYGLTDNILDTKYFNNFSDPRNEIRELIGSTPNYEYYQYWHGVIMFIRPLLSIMNIEGIYSLNYMFLSILFIVLMILLWNKKDYISILILFVGMLMCNFIIVGSCLEFVPTVYLMLITSIIITLFPNQKNHFYYVLFFIIGMSTAFFDFLTTELLTIAIPLMLLIRTRKKDDDLIRFCFTSLFIWALGYIMMMTSKWLLIAITNHEYDIWTFVKGKILYWTEPKENYKVNWFSGLIRNLKAIFPFQYMNDMTIIIFFEIYICFYLLFSKRKNNLKSYVYLAIGCLPFLRYIVLSFHSYYHCYFMCRDLLVTIYGLTMAYVVGIDQTLLRRKHETNHFNARLK